TTTAMTGRILTEAGRKPSVILGAELCETGQAAWSGSSDLFVVESCEFQRNFLAYRPRYAAILSIETDHVDCFQNLAELQQAFTDFAGQVAPDGVLLIRSDAQGTLDLTRQSLARVATFGWSLDADWWADDLRKTPYGIRFRAYHQSQFFSEITLRIPGR